MRVCVRVLRLPRSVALLIQFAGLGRDAAQSSARAWMRISSSPPRRFTSRWLRCRAGSDFPKARSCC